MSVSEICVYDYSFFTFSGATRNSLVNFKHYMEVGSSLCCSINLQLRLKIVVCSDVEFVL